MRYVKRKQRDDPITPSMRRPRVGDCRTPGVIDFGGDPVGTVVSAVDDNGTVHAQRYASALNTRYSPGSAPLHFGIPPGASIPHLQVRWPYGSVVQRPVQGFLREPRSCYDPKCLG